MLDQMTQLVAETMDANEKLKGELSLAHEEIEKLGKERDAATAARARENFAGSYHLDGIEQLLRSRAAVASENETQKVLLKKADVVAESLRAAVDKLDEIGKGVPEELAVLKDKFGLLLIELGFDRRPIGALPMPALEDFRKALDEAAETCDNLTDFPADWSEAINEFEELKEEEKP